MVYSGGRGTSRFSQRCMADIKSRWAVQAAVPTPQHQLAFAPGGAEQAEVSQPLLPQSAGNNEVMWLDSCEFS